MPGTTGIPCSRPRQPLTTSADTGNEWRKPDSHRRGQCRRFQPLMPGSPRVQRALAVSSGQFGCAFLPYLRSRLRSNRSFKRDAKSLRALSRLNSSVMTHSRHPRRVSCQSNKRVPELDGRCVGFALPQRRLVRRFATLIAESNLMRASRSFPAQLQRRLGAVVVEPCGLGCAVSVGALPYLANPSAIDAALPANAGGRGKSVRRPCSGFCLVFQHAAKSAHGFKRRGKAAAIVAGPVVFAAPSLVVDRRKRAPQLARGVRNNRPRPSVFAGVALFRPSVNIRQVPISPLFLNIQGRYFWCAQDNLPQNAIPLLRCYTALGSRASHSLRSLAGS